MLTIGTIFKNEREKKKYTLEHIEKLTKIRKQNIQAIEESDFKKFPSKMYIIGIIRSYSRVFELDENKMIAFFHREYERHEDLKFKQGVDERKVAPQKKKNFRIILSLITFLFIFYFAYQVKLYLTPPRLIILEPTQINYTVEDKIQIVGKVENDSTVTVNGEKVYPDDNNIFKTMIPLTQKVNTVTIEVTGANGRKTVVKKQYFKKI